MTSDAVRGAIEAADVERLRSLVAREPALAGADVACGERGQHRVPALHLVCDAVFRGAASDAEGLAMAQVLLDAGADPERAYAKSGDTFLIAAASLGAEGVGLRLVELGVDVRARGLFAATALHWAALMGLARLAAALLDAGAELELVDARYDCTPLEWALHAWTHGTNGRRDGLPDVTRVLVARGARVPAGALEALTGPDDGVLRGILREGRDPSER